METLSSKIFRNTFVEAFEGDESGLKQPRQTHKVLYSKVLPTPVSRPSLLAWSDDLAKELKMEKAGEKEVAILSGNLVTPSMQPYAACYGGHQFGNWAGQLGDGRAITLGEWKVPEGKSWELQLKGPGPTPYSRRADGRAVLRSSVREYLMSEAMHYLGVPTTRALSLVSTGDKVMRDMFYDGHPAYEPGAIVTRVAPSFLRFGNFEILAARSEIQNLRRLTDWTIANFYPHLQGNTEEKTLAFFGEVVERTAHMVAEWLRVGFVHGVMNTDNMSILGLTIDYGPYSFVDDYDLNFTPNTTDLPGRRYAFGKQASIAYWNLGCLAGALAPLFEETAELEETLKGFENIFWSRYFQLQAQKTGLHVIEKEDIELLQELESLLSRVKPDMTMFYQLLMDVTQDLNSEEAFINHFKESFYTDPQPEDAAAFVNWLQKRQLRISNNGEAPDVIKKSMQAASPRFILRNYLLHQAIEALEDGDPSLFNQLEEAIKEPYSRKFDQFFKKRPDWATQKAGCSMLSCSS